MTDEEMLAWLLQQIDFRKGDNWWRPCCSDCGYNAWHQRTDYDIGTPCDCPCHQVRGRLGIPDNLAAVGTPGRAAWDAIEQAHGGPAEPADS